MRQIFKPPVFENEGQTNQAHLLNIILWALIIMPIPYVLYTVLAAPGAAGRALTQMAIGETANLFLLFLLKRRQIQLASVLQVTLFWLFFNVVAFTGSGVRGPAFTLGSGLVIVVAGVLLGGWGASAFTLISLLSGLIMARMETQGLRTFTDPGEPLAYWIIALATFPVGALLQNLAARSVRNVLQKSRASETRYRLLFEESPDGIIIVDARGQIIEVNPAACELLGYRAAEMLGKNPEDFADKEPAAPAFSYEQAKTGQTLAREQVFIHKNGRHVSIFGNIKQLPNARYQFIFQDITERKQAEANLAQSEAILQAVAFAAGRFFATNDWTNEIDLVLERLGKVLKASHAYLFQVYADATGELRSSMKYEWCAPGFPSEVDQEIYQNNPVLEPGFDKSFDMFNTGQLYILRQPADAQSPQELEYLQDIGVQALIDIPLIVNGQWWGTLGFDDCVKPRDWSNAELDALKVAGNVVSAAIERKLAEAALRASENRLRLALESAHIGIWDWDIVNNSVAWLDKVENLFGLAPGTFDGKYETYLGLIHPEDQVKLQHAINDALTGKNEPYYVEHRILTTQGHLRWLEGKGEVYRDEQGQPMRMLGTVMDITERKQNEQAQNATYRIAQAALETTDLSALYRSIHDILNELMPAQNLLIVLYDAANDLFNVSYLKDDYDRDAAPYHPGKGLCGYVLRTGQPLLITPERFDELERAGEVEILIHRMVDWLGIPLKTQRGIIGVIAIQTYSTDIRLHSEHKEMLMFVSTQIAAAIERQQTLAEIQRLNFQLEQRVRERTAQLELANRELESFSFSVSHDLRAPLRAIRSYSQIIMGEQSVQLSAEGREHLGKVIAGAHQMNELIEALLSLARISRSDMRKSRLDLTALAHTILQELAQADPNRAVTCLIAEGLSTYADEKLLNIVLQNLLGNAWKYTARVAPARIEFGRQRLEGEEVFFVRDNGIGFDMKYSAKLFGAFQRLHPVDEFPGHGIGLATVQRIINRHGGRVWAEAAPNAGATFYFSIPKPDQD